MIVSAVRCVVSSGEGTASMRMPRCLTSHTPARHLSEVFDLQAEGDTSPAGVRRRPASGRSLSLHRVFRGFRLSGRAAADRHRWSRRRARSSPRCRTECCTQSGDSQTTWPGMSSRMRTNFSSRCSTPSILTWWSRNPRRAVARERVTHRALCTRFSVACSAPT